ncbi:hypothetical protein [Kingella oralis]|uniref:hypothetical protein n=1 Tax=Kingella oralis TaxID=505 RepID=UPI0012DC58CA|nr:hypothetical protein [Kingella oralis]QMT43480.1 hypothetical protein H3L93_03840 [Kingella oralis]
MVRLFLCFQAVLGRECDVWQPERVARTGCRGLPLLVVGGETPARAKNGQWQPETGMGFQAASKSMISMPS